MWGPPWKPHVMEASSIKVMIIFFSIQPPVHVKACHKEAEAGVFPGYYEINVAHRYCWRKIEEKYNQKKSLAVWFPTYLLYLPGNLNWHPWCICSILNLILILLCNPESLSSNKANLTFQKTSRPEPINTQILIKIIIWAFLLVSQLRKFDQNCMVSQESE